MGQIIRCKLDRWGGKGGDMKVVLSMSKRYAGLIAQIPEDGDLLLKPLQLQPELPLFDAVSDTELEQLAEAERRMTDGAGEGEEVKPKEVDQMDGRDITKPADWFEFNDKVARCDFCEGEFGRSTLRRWKDPEKPQGWWCRKCGVKEKLIGESPPILDYEVNEHSTVCEGCRNRNYRGALRRWTDVRVANTGWLCEKCSQETEGPTPWYMEGPPVNAGAFEEAPAPKRPPGPETGVVIDFDPERVMVNRGPVDCFGAANCQCTDAPMGALRAYFMPSDPNMSAGWWCEKCGERLNADGVELHPWAPSERIVREITWHVFRSEVMRESQVATDSDHPWAEIPDHKRGSREHREAVKEAVKQGFDVWREELEPYIMRKWAATEIMKGGQRLKMAELLESQSSTYVDSSPVPGKTQGKGKLQSDETTAMQLKQLKPGTENHRRGVMLFLSTGAELGLEHLEPYADEPWAEHAIAALGEKKTLAGDPGTPVDIGLEGFTPGTQEHRVGVRSILNAGKLVSREHLEPYKSRIWARRALKALDEQASASTSATKPEVQGGDPSVPPIDWEMQDVRKDLHYLPGSDKHRDAVCTLLSHGENVEIAHLVDYVNEPWAEKEMGRAYPAVKAAAEAKALAERQQENQGAEDVPLEIRLQSFTPGSEEHRTLVRTIISMDQEVPVEHLAPYVDEAWAREEMGDRYRAAQEAATAQAAEKKFGAQHEPHDPILSKDFYQCRVCLTPKHEGVMEKYFIAEGEGRYVCHGCLQRIGIKPVEVPREKTVFVEEMQCGECHKLFPFFVMKLGDWKSPKMGELYCPNCHERLRSREDNQTA